MEINPKDVQYYDHIQKVLSQKQQHKALKFVELGLIEYNGNGTFTCHKIEGYNTRDYTIQRHPDFHFECNCQGWQTKHKRLMKGDDIYPTCSHVAALFVYFKTRHGGEWMEAKNMLAEFEQPA